MVDRLDYSRGVCLQASRVFTTGGWTDGSVQTEYNLLFIFKIWRVNCTIRKGDNVNNSNGETSSPGNLPPPSSAHTWLLTSNPGKWVPAF